MIIASASALATPYFLKIIIDDIFPNKTYRDLIQVLLILVGIYIIRIGTSICIDVLYTKVSKGLISDIRINVYEKILRKELDFFRKQKSGEVIFLLTNDIGNIQNTLSSLILNTTNHIFTITGILIMLFTLNTPLTIISLLSIPFLIISIKSFIPYIKQNFEKIQKEESKIYDYMVNRINNIRVILSYGTISHETNKAKHMHQTLINVSVKNALFEALSNNITTFLIALGPIIILIYGGKMIFETTLSIGSLIAFIQYLNKLYTPAINLSKNFNDYQKAKISMQRIYKHIENVNAPLISTEVSNTIENLTIEDVSFSYGDKSILRNVNLNFKKGKIYGIIGESGSGKSSIINLLCKLEKPIIGKVKANNQDINKINNWTDHIALVERENQLFNDSILNNIIYGSPIGKHKFLKQIILNAQLTDVIANSKEGVNTQVSNSTTVISDGQKQRISIARALLKSPSIILLDEATSALNIELEEKIIENIKKNFKDSIVIIVTHRLNLIKKFDHIYKVGNKNVAEVLKNNTESYIPN